MAYLSAGGQLCGFGKLAREEQGAYFVKVLGCLGVVAVLHAAGPHAFLVELDAFTCDIAEHHGSQGAIAQRQGIVPLQVVRPTVGAVGHGGIRRVVVP